MCMHDIIYIFNIVYFHFLYIFYVETKTVNKENFINLSIIRYSYNLC